MAVHIIEGRLVDIRVHGNRWFRTSYIHDRIELGSRTPVRMEPFTPVLIGKQQIANFQQTSLPDVGTIFLGLFPLLLMAAMWFSRRPRT